jgi:hypothetical protein
MCGGFSLPHLVATTTRRGQSPTFVHLKFSYVYPFGQLTMSGPVVIQLPPGAHIPLMQGSIICLSMASPSFGRRLRYFLPSRHPCQ